MIDNLKSGTVAIFFCSALFTVNPRNSSQLYGQELIRVKVSEFVCLNNNLWHHNYRKQVPPVIKPFILGTGVNCE